MENSPRQFRADRWATPACWDWPLPVEPRTTNPVHLLFEWHAGRCAVCGAPVGVILEDHDHDTGLTRGWLCGPCNLAEGTQDGVYVLYRKRPPASIVGVSFRYSALRNWHGVKRFKPWLSSSVRYMQAEGIELAKLGRRRARAKATFEKVNDEAKAAVVAAAEAGVPEAELARVLQVDRMTVRSWLGKRR